MTRPNRYLLTMVLFLVIIGAGVAIVFPSLSRAFLANPVLNGGILGTLIIGLAHAFRTILALNKEITWIEDFKRSAEGGLTLTGTPPRLMAPAATMLGERSGRTGHLNLSPTAMQTLLDGVATRLDETRETSRYMVALLVFLGLLGTFWGLMETINSVGDVISNLQIGSDSDIAGAFGALKSGLRQPLEGMGTAFSSSLFGLSGSLILGFAALQSGQAQNLFYRDLEDWLSGITRLGGGGVMAEGDHAVPAYVQALLEQTADSLEALQRTLMRSEEGRQAEQQNLAMLTDKLAGLADTMKVEQDLLLKLAQSQQELKTVLGKGGQGGGMDEASRNHLRSMESHLSRLVSDMPRARAETVQDIRNEIRLLARTIAALAEGGEA
ncbi:flagellar motor protein MotA [Aestuariispira insulae]|uniref:MotA/TolQ/ExbB proton channel family protein n=1 Tax=Aestuariispira insulae TaxID=1461337 RepID=A0A3D9HJX9_9PROT|nr:flagellar motor protein MotA [Aestuariispira insulae]RED49764.1 hypothetical protein DFP90_105135 [Aestuariispira insulae]